MIYTLKNNEIEVKVNSLGAELVSVVSKSGFEYIWQGAQWPKHAPVLFPICGSLRDEKYVFNAREYHIGKHGFAKFYDFELKESSDTHVTLELASNEETLAVYPFEFSLSARFSIEGNALSVVFTLDNTGKIIMPYMFGWHPAFNLGGDAPSTLSTSTLATKRSSQDILCRTVRLSIPSTPHILLRTENTTSTKRKSMRMTQ